MDLSDFPVISARCALRGKEVSYSSTVRDYLLSVYLFKNWLKVGAAEAPLGNQAGVTQVRVTPLRPEFPRAPNVQT